jgi:hypothetical protein
MEAVDVNKDVDKVLRLIEKKRESVLVLKDGRPHCMNASCWFGRGRGGGCPGGWNEEGT